MAAKKRQPGRPRLKQNELRVRLTTTTVDRSSVALLRKLATRAKMSQGRVLDMLIHDAAKALA